MKTNDGNGVLMSGKRVLVVDDDAIVCSVIQEVLEEEGFSVESAMGPKALTLAQRRPPDLILLELFMPMLNGWEIRRRLLADPRTRQVPCVLLSSEEGLHRAARELRAQACLPKPFELDDLIQVVRRSTDAA
jgi:CheY-like chemotaxis protein